MFKRRIAALLILFLLGASGLVGRLFELSIFQHGAYVALAAAQQSTQITIQPQRGTVWFQDAATGQPVLAVQSVQGYSVSAIPFEVQQKAAVAHILAAATGTDEATLLTKLQADGKYLAPLKHGLTLPQAQSIVDQINAAEKAAMPNYASQSVNFGVQLGDNTDRIDGVFFTSEYSETYPQGSLASQVLGFVNGSGSGQYGFEGEYDSSLKGYAGTSDVQVDSEGNLLQENTVQPGANGDSYELTIDQNVQYEAEKDLAAEVQSSGSSSGSLIVMDPKTGAIIALANTPSFDPNDYGSVSNIADLSDQAVSGSWEPGSIFKDLVMAAALNEGVVTPDTTSTFPESVTVQGYKIETALRRAYGTENMAQVLANSDNVAMVWVANKLGNQKMYQYIKAFGFGQPTGIDLQGEISGNVLPLDQWQDINRATMAFGQGIAVTPIQILTAYAALADNGRMVQPHVVQTVIAPDGTKTQVKPTYGAQVVKPAIAKEVLDMMQYTVDDADKKAGEAGYAIGGKTGTAQIPDPVNGGYIANAYNHSFVGLDTVDDPRFITLVKLDNPDVARVGLYAESTAIPLFSQFSSFLLSYYQIHPTSPVPSATPVTVPTPTPTPAPTPTPSATPTP